MKIAEAYVELRVQSDKAKREAVAQTRTLAQDMTRTFAQYFSAAIVGNEIRKTVNAASELQQAVGGTEAVFGRAQRTVNEFARESANAVGLSERAFRELSSQIGGLLKGFDFTQDAAADTSIKIVQLGADLAATFGGQPDEAVRALGAALRGEFDPLERFGVSLRQSQINLKAVELGLAESTTAVDGNARAQAALAIITEQTADAQGQFGREADTAAGKQARFTAQLENQRAEIGNALLPVYGALLESLSLILDVFGALPPQVQTATVALLALAAVSGPLSTAVTAMNGLRTAVVAFGRVHPVLLAIGIAATAAATAFALMRRESDNTAEAIDRQREAVDDLRSSMEAFEDPTDAVRQRWRELIGENDFLRQAMIELGLTIDDLISTTDPYEFDRLTLGILQTADGSWLADEALKQLRSDMLDLRQETDLAYRELDELAQVEGGLTDATDETSDALERQAIKFADVEVGMRDVIQVSGRLRDEYTLLMDAAGALGSAIENVFGGQLGVDEAGDRVLQGFNDLYGQITGEDGERTLNRNTEAGRRNRDAVRGQVQAIFDLAQANVRAGASTEEAENQVTMLNQQLRNQLAAAGLARDEIDSYIDSLGLTPDKISTAIALTDEQIARNEIEDYKASLDGIPSEIETEIGVLIDNGAFDEAEERLDRLLALYDRVWRTSNSGHPDAPDSSQSRSGATVTPSGAFAHPSLPGTGSYAPGTPTSVIDQILGTSPNGAPLMPGFPQAMPTASSPGAPLPTELTVVIEGRPFRAAIVDYERERQAVK